MSIRARVAASVFLYLSILGAQPPDETSGLPPASAFAPAAPGELKAPGIGRTGTKRKPEDFFSGPPGRRHRYDRQLVAPADPGINIGALTGLPPDLIGLVGACADEPVFGSCLSHVRREGFPFLDLDTGERFPGGPRDVVLEEGEDGQLSDYCFGYGLTVPIFFSLPGWDTVLFSYADHRTVPGPDAPGAVHTVRRQFFGGERGVAQALLSFTGGVRTLQFEGLRRSDDGGWISRVSRHRVMIRGLRIEAGRPGEPGLQDGYPLTAGCLAPFDVLPNAFIGPKGKRKPFKVFTDGHALRTQPLGGGPLRTVCGDPAAPGFRDGAKDEARFNRPTYLADMTLERFGGPGLGPWWTGGEPWECAVLVLDAGNKRVRAVNLEDGRVVSLPGEGLEQPQGLAAIQKPTRDGRTTTVICVADQGRNQILYFDVATQGFRVHAGLLHDPEANDGPRAVARFRNLQGLAFGGPNAAWLFVIDGHALRRVDARGKVTTLAGCVDAAGYLDSPPAGQPCFNHPTGIAATGNSVYIADTGNHCIRHYDLLTGALSTVAGDPADPVLCPGLLRDGLAELPDEPHARYATLEGPRGLHVDPRHNGTMLGVATGACVGVIDHPMPDDDGRIQALFPRGLKPGSICQLGFQFSRIGAELPEDVEDPNLLGDFRYVGTWLLPNGQPVPGMDIHKGTGRLGQPVRILANLPSEGIARDLRLHVRILDYEGYSYEGWLPATVAIPGPGPAAPLPVAPVADPHGAGVPPVHASVFNEPALLPVPEPPAP